MFNNASSKIESVVEICAGILIFICLAAAVVALLSDGFMAFLVLIINALIVYISALFILSFIELVHTTKEINAKLDKIIDKDNESQLS